LGDLIRADRDALGDLDCAGDFEREESANGVSSDFVDLWPLFLPREWTGGNLPD